MKLARTWAKGDAILFAVGAVSGTVLSFELGLLLPTFMRHAGAIIGMPFALEGFAFFTEAIFSASTCTAGTAYPRACTSRAGLVVAVERATFRGVRRHRQCVDERAARLRLGTTRTAK